MNQAIRPDFFNALPPVEDKAVEGKGPTDDERLLYSLSKSGGWRVLSTYINDMVAVLDASTGSALEKGQTFEEIGRNAVVISLAKDIIRKITNRVEDAKEVCEKPDGTIK